MSGSGTVLERLIVELDASTAGLRQQLNRGSADVATFGRNVDKNVQTVEQRFAKLGSSLRSALAAFGVGFSVAGVVNFTRSSIQAADAIGEAAAAAGLGAERFQRLGFVFRQNGVSAAEFESALRTSNTRLGEFITTGAGPAAKAIRELGLEQRIANGEITNNQQLVDVLIGSLGAVRNDAQRAALSAAFFGREIGAKLAAALAVGERAMESAAEAATGIFSDERVRQANELADAWERIANATSTWAKSLAIGAAHDIGNALDIEGLKQPGAEGRLAWLETLQRRRQAIGFDLDQSQQVELADLRAQMANRANYRTGGSLEDYFAAQQPAAGVPALGRSLRRIDVNNIGDLNARPGLRRPSIQLEELDALQEIQAVVARMPDDLRRWTPEMNAFANALRESRDEVEPLQRDLDAFADSLGGAFEDTLASAFLGVETDFGSMLRRLAANLAASGLMHALGAAFSGSTGAVSSFLSTAFGGARASGGPVSSGKSYLVGERGPELFVPDVSGMIRTAAQARASGGVTVIVENHGPRENVQMSSSKGPDGNEIVRFIVGAVQGAMAGGEFDMGMRHRFGVGRSVGTR